MEDEKVTNMKQPIHFSKMRWSSHHASLIVMHQMGVFFKLQCIHHKGTKPYTSCESPHLYQTQEVKILVPISSFWVHEGQKQFEPKHFYQQNLNDLFYQNKILLNGLYGRNVYNCTLQHRYDCDVYEHDVHEMYVEGYVLEHVKFVSYEIWIPIYCV